MPIAQSGSGNPYAADLSARTSNAGRLRELLAPSSVDLLLDGGGTGLHFERSAVNDSLDLFHERLRIPLCSHFVDPLGTALQGLDWPVVWQSLQSALWLKFVWDRAHAAELQRLGVPQVFHLPMAAPVRNYLTDPLDARKTAPIVSFVGGQNTTFFADGHQIPAAHLLPAAMTLGIQTDLRDVTFFDAYHDIYGIGSPILDSDDLGTRIRKTAAYFTLKECYHAALCMRQRDRFVLFLKRKLGDHFRLIGARWNEAYGLAAEPPFPGNDAYFNHFRETAININLVNGNAETGLNMRHFEITAAGGFMLCYQQPELAEYFEVGKECVTFSSEADLLEKIRYYLSRPAERAAIALAGQKRTLAQHLYSHRLQTVLQTVRPLTQTFSVTYSASTLSQDLPRIVPAPRLILDCGANTGQMAEAFRRLYPQATIYSFEPVSSVFEQLRARAAELNLRPVRKAVGDADEPATINLTASPQSNSLLGYEPGNPCDKYVQIVGRETIEVCTLDAWCAQSGVDPSAVDILKLDVQGAELKALYGAKGLLRHLKAVYVEVSFVRIYREAPLFDEIESFMQECGFRRYAIYPSDQPHYWGDALYVRG